MSRVTIDAAVAALPYCGTPPVPADWYTRWNLDPWLLVALAAGYLALRRAVGTGSEGPDVLVRRALALRAGGLLVALALVSPLCALSVALFSMRVLQHLLLLYVAAPLLALALAGFARRPPVAASATAFTVLFWLWHAPGPYGATFDSTATYWAMHVSLLVSAVGAWWSILDARDSEWRAPGALLGSVVLLVQMGLLGAVLSFAPHPLYFVHLLTTLPFGLTALEDQQLGGLLMWVPGALAPLAIGIALVTRLLRGPIRH